ncbi:MAG: formylglycine-generating enzyme family protein [Deltaproteobacteria bacterium]|nr:formylglycine-generating enzyme family protein [Deltaproteobacteria bacterium]
MSARGSNISFIPPCPSWAGGYGRDGFGYFAELVWGDLAYVMRFIPAGVFMMGSPGRELGRFSDEGPLHRVVIEEGFWLGETPLTQGFYQAITKNNPSHFKGDSQRPAEKVSWEDSQTFCQMLDKMLQENLPDAADWQARLPSEAEWEYACRAGTRTALYNEKELTSERGSCPNLDELAWYDANSDGTTHPVKQKAANQFGLYDMLGNVWEWCEDDWHGDYQNAPADGSAWVEPGDRQGRFRVLRGGSWLDYARRCRSAHRRRNVTGNRDDILGFRLVLAPSLRGNPEDFHKPG